MTETNETDGFGVLLVNLGSPDSPSVPDVRRYLHQFLMDGRVIDAPYLIRKMIVCCFILPTRPARSAEAYRSIWWDEGSPLVVLSRRAGAALQERVRYPVEIGMRYGSPSIADGIASLQKRVEGGLRRLFIVPLYPHYAMSTYETVMVEAEEALKAHPGVRMQAQPAFYSDPHYLNALQGSIAEHLDGSEDHVLFSYHGLPERHLRKTDPSGTHCLATENCCETASPAHARCYRAQAFATTRAVCEGLGLDPAIYSNAFQSRLGRDPWLQPFTSARIAALAKDGVRNLKVVCPSFVSDCLETLEEMGMEGKETFLAAGGERFELIPCLNTRQEWIEALQTWSDHAYSNGDR